jgi:hypothetical protein
MTIAVISKTGAIKSPTSIFPVTNGSRFSVDWRKLAYVALAGTGRSAHHTNYQLQAHTSRSSSLLVSGEEEHGANQSTIWNIKSGCSTSSTDQFTTSL